MRWLSLGCVMVIALLSGLLGLTVGINLNYDTAVKNLSGWGSVGDWVSGIGALLAVLVALWQSFVQLGKERIRTLILDETHDRVWSLRIVSEGLVPVIVLDAYLMWGSTKLRLSEARGLMLAFPKKLERGDLFQLISLEDDRFDVFAEWLVGPLVRELQGKGITPSNFDGGFNEEYFSRLNHQKDLKAELIVRCAHGDVKHRVSKTTIELLVNSVYYAHREQREMEIKKYRGEILDIYDALDSGFSRDKYR